METRKVRKDTHCSYCGAPVHKGEVARYEEGLPRGNRYLHTSCPVPSREAVASPTTLETYEDFGAFLDASEAMQPGEQWKARGLDSDMDPSDRFHHGATFADTVNMARNGWASGMAAVRREIDVAAPARSNGAAAAYAPAVAGFRPHVGRFAAGAPDCMVGRNEGGLSPSSVVKLVVDLTNHCGVDAQHIVRWGAALALTVDKLEADGTTVEVVGVLETTGDGHGTAPSQTLAAHVTLKRSGMVLDLDRLAFMVAHPAVLRRLFFRHIERDEFYPSHRLGYGRPTFHTARLLRDHVAIGSGAKYRLTVSEAVASINKHIEKGQ